MQLVQWMDFINFAAYYFKVGETKTLKNKMKFLTFFTISILPYFSNVDIIFMNTQASTHLTYTELYFDAEDAGYELNIV